MYKCILVPLDGSRKAEAILPHVEELALNFKAKLVFLQMVEMPPMMMGSETPYLEGFQAEMEEMAKQAELYLETIKGEFREKGIKAKIRVLHGPAVEGIINSAESESADLIAMASHGRTGLVKVFYGSVTAGVMHKTDRPLLLVRSA